MFYLINMIVVLVSVLVVPPAGLNVLSVFLPKKLTIDVFQVDKRMGRNDNIVQSEEDVIWSSQWLVVAFGILLFTVPPPGCCRGC